MILEKTGYGYNDLTLVPQRFTYIKHRKDINPLTKFNMLPIFAAPMTTIVSESNIGDFYANKITPILPRGTFSYKDPTINKEEDFNKRINDFIDGYWVAFSLKEAKNLYDMIYSNNLKLDKKFTYYLCIDVANGHMESIYELAYDMKELFKKKCIDIEIMTGNIANPETYKSICEYTMEDHNHKMVPVIDYIRVGIGGGYGCITSPQTAVHYAQASLIDECNKYKPDTEYRTKIVADGGIRNYGDVIKALALGADYVMIGSLFGTCVESAGDKYIDMNNNGQPTYWVDREANDDDLILYKDKLYSEFYGMASKQGQIDMFGQKTKTAEGNSKFIKVDTTLKKWSENMIAYLRSAMSYCNCTNLDQFIGNQVLLPTAIGEMNSVNK